MSTRLLVVDDSITIQRVVELTFKDEDIEITSVEDGFIALEKIKESRPDIIIADITMPGLNGVELCKKLKDTPEYSSIPILLMTGSGEIDKRKYDLACPDGYISKPFKSEELIEQVRRLIKGGPSPPLREVQTEEGDSSEKKREEGRMDNIRDQNKEMSGESEIDPEEEVILRLGPDDEIPDEGGVFQDKGEADTPDFSMEQGDEVDNKEMELAEEEREELLAEFDKEGIEEELAPEEEEVLLADTDTEEEVDNGEDVSKIEEDIDIKEEKTMKFESIQKEKAREIIIGEDGIKGVIEPYIKGVAEKVLKETIKTTVSELSNEISNTVKEIVEEVVPNLAKRLIREEIERLRKTLL